MLCDSTQTGVFAVNYYKKRLENELKDLSTKEDIANIRIDMANMETRIIKWNVGTIIAAVGITVAIVKLIG